MVLTLKRRGLLMLATIAALSGGCGSTSPKTSIAPSQPPVAVTAGNVVQPSQPSTPASSLDDYVIGPQDLLQISVFQADALSRKVRVSSRGSITLPPIGLVQAAGLTSAELETQIAAQLRDCCMQDPQVSIFIEEFVSQRVTVEGEVKTPGVYPLHGRTTLLQAVALAAGSSNLADLSNVAIMREQRGGDGVKDMLVFDLREIREGKIADPVIQGNDVIVVSRSSSQALLKNITDTLRGFVGFRNL